MAAPRQWALSVRHHVDVRRTFYGDIFANPDGDTNVVYLRPHVPIGWHRHQRQADRLFLISGVLRVRVFDHDPRDAVEHMLTARDRGVLHIPENRWHGYEALTEHTILLQFNGPGKWTGEDEERLSLDEIPWTL
jgi:dTDP-4-dehydrorhamnose 3,5-epimerase-like enzyme